MSFNDFIIKYDLQNKTTSNIKKQIFSSLSLNILRKYLRDGPFSSDVGIVNLHPQKGTHSVAYTNKKYLDSYGCSIPTKLSKFIKKRNGFYLYSAVKIQGLTNKGDSYCAAYCSYIIQLTKMLGINFKSAVLTLYYQTIS